MLEGYYSSYWHVKCKVRSIFKVNDISIFQYVLITFMNHSEISKKQYFCCFLFVSLYAWKNDLHEILRCSPAVLLRFRLDSIWQLSAERPVFWH